jgi:hypothetical protein
VSALVIEQRVAHGVTYLVDTIPRSHHPRENYFMVHSRLILCACLLVVALALGADSYSRWGKPAAIPASAAIPSATCPHSNLCPYCRGWDAFEAGESVSDNPFPGPSNDPTSAWIRWKWGWEAGHRKRVQVSNTAVAKE